MTALTQTSSGTVSGRGVIRRAAGCLAVAAAVLVAGLAAPTAQADPVQHVVGSFESDDEGWALGLGGEFPGAQGDFNRDDAAAHGGTYSGLLAGDFGGGGKYVQISRSLDVDPQEIRLWVRTDDLTRVRLRMTDATGQKHQQRLALQPVAGWQELVVRQLDAGDGYIHWDGANDGVWHGPAQRIALVVDEADLVAGTSGQVRFDDVTLSAAPPDLEIEQVATGNVFVQPESVDVGVVTRGNRVEWSLHDFWGDEIASGAADGGQIVLEDLIDEVGYYQLDVTAFADGEPIGNETTDVALLSSFDVSEIDDSPFGVVPHFVWEDNFDKMPLAAKMGVKNIRDDATWASVESEPGVYTYDRYDPMKAQLDENSLRWMPLVVYTNPHYDDNATPHTDDGREGYANYAANLATHYDDSPWVEIYNEFNIGFGSRGDSPANSRADYYFPLLKAAYEEIKEVRPEMTVVGGGTSSVPLDWLEELFSLGGLEYMDAVSIHPYIYPEEPEALTELVQDVDELVQEYNDGESMPIWITEQGWPTNEHTEGVTESEQATNLVRSQVTALAAGVDKFFWHQLMNNGTNESNREENFGVIRNVSDQRGSYVPKPAYVSYAAMTRQLTGATYKSTDDVAAGVHSHVFSKGDGELRVMWSEEPAAVTVRTDRPVTVTDLMGASRTYHPHAGRVHLSVSDQPIYVEGTDFAVEPGQKLTVDASAAAVGEPVTFTVDVDNSVTPRAPIVGTFEIADQSVPVSIRPGEQESITVTLDPEQVAGEYVYTGELVAHGRSIARLSATTEIVEPVAVTAQHVLRDGADTLAVSVRNNSADPITQGELTWDVGPEAGSITLPSHLPPGEAWTHDISLDDLPLGSHDRALRVAVPGYQDIVESGQVEMLESDELTPIANRPITVDGVAEDMTDVPGFDLATDGTIGGRWVDGVDHWAYGGDEDLSGQVWPTWDDNNLYLTAVLTDNVHDNRYPAPTQWTGDSLQFSVSAGTASEERPLAYYGFSVGGAPGEEQLYRRLTASANVPVGLVENAELVISRDGSANQTVYELAIPWGEIDPVNPDARLLGFSLSINDNDGLDRKGSIGLGLHSMRLDAD